MFSVGRGASFCNDDYCLAYFDLLFAVYGIATLSRGDINYLDNFLGFAAPYIGKYALIFDLLREYLLCLGINIATRIISKITKRLHFHAYFTKQ